MSSMIGPFQPLATCLALRLSVFVRSLRISASTISPIDGSRSSCTPDGESSNEWFHTAQQGKGSQKANCTPDGESSNE